MNHSTRLPVVRFVLIVAFCLHAPLLFGASDVLSLGTPTSAAGSFTVPVFLRDVSGTPIGVDQPLASQKPQALSFRITYTGGTVVTGGTIARAGVLAAVTPSFENFPKSSGSSTYLAVFDAPLPLRSNPATPGDLIANITFTLGTGAVPGTVIPITIDPSATSTTLSNQGGTVSETVSGGDLSVVNTSYTIPLNPDVMTVGTVTTGTDVPVYLRDISGGVLGGDRISTERIQGLSFRINYSPASAIASANVTRGGITTALTPSFENSPAGAGSLSYIASFTTLPLTLDAAAPGDQIATLHFTPSATAAPGTVVSLTIDPLAAVTGLTNLGGTISETVAAGTLTLVNGSFMVPLKPDVITVGTVVASSSTVSVPIHVRDVSGSKLGTDAGSTAPIRSLAFRVTYAPASSVSSVSVARAGVTANLAPSFESTPAPASGTISYLATFPVNIPLVTDAAAPGDQVATLTFVTSPAAPGKSVITLTLDPQLSTLSDQGGTVSESTGTGTLTLVNGTLTIADKASGDANGDGGVTVGDVFTIVNSLFSNGGPVVGNADANGDGQVTVSDIFYLINFLFAGGPPPK